MNKNIVLTISCIAFFFSCNTKDKKENNQDVTSSTIIEDSPLKSISALYYNYLHTTKGMIYPEDLKLRVPTFTTDDYIGILDAEITDTLVLDKINDLVKQLEIDSSRLNSWRDARIVALLNYENGKQDTLSIEGSLPDNIYLNGIAHKPDNRLIYLIKNNIGFYPWFIGDKLYDMKELQDNSFMKEPFISSDYYKTWQKNRSEE